MNMLRSTLSVKESIFMTKTEILCACRKMVEHVVARSGTSKSMSTSNFLMCCAFVDCQWTWSGSIAAWVSWVMSIGLWNFGMYFWKNICSYNSNIENWIQWFLLFQIWILWRLHSICGIWEKVSITVVRRVLFVYGLKHGHVHRCGGIHRKVNLWDGFKIIKVVEERVCTVLEFW